MEDINFLWWEKLDKNWQDAFKRATKQTEISDTIIALRGLTDIFLFIRETEIDETSTLEMLKKDDQASKFNYNIDLTPLSVFTNLRELGINNILWKVDLTPISNLSELERLELNLDCVDLKPLTKLKKLNTFFGHFWGSTDLSVLPQINSLRELITRVDSQEKINNISEITQLELLELNHSADGEVCFDKLDKLNNLTQLDLLSEGIENFDFLSKLSKLIYLQIYSPVYFSSDFYEILKLPNLKLLLIFDYYGGVIPDFSKLTKLSHLSLLEMNGMELTEDNLEILNKLTYLKRLRLPKSFLTNRKYKKDIKKLLDTIASNK